MSLARPIVFGNWKMNGLRAEAEALCDGIRTGAAAVAGATLGVFPPATAVQSVVAWMAGTDVMVGGQDCHSEAAGAYTGDISAAMLTDAGAGAVIVGHSERRQGHDETNAVVLAKAEAAGKAGLLTVICIGETEAQYVAGETLAVLTTQLAESVPARATANSVVVAYEPVWAIGTGRTPTTHEIASVHADLRRQLVERFADGDQIAILYGGSVKPGNAPEILALDNVDGALVGGASLKTDEFLAIARAGLT